MTPSHPVVRLPAPIPARTGAVVFSAVVETLCPIPPLFCHGALLPWTIARMRCRTSGDRRGQAAMTSLSDGSSGTNWALMDGEQVVGGWCSDGKRVVGLPSSGPLTTPDRGLIRGLAGSSGSESDRLRIPHSSSFFLPTGGTSFRVLEDAVTQSIGVIAMRWLLP